MEIKSGDHVVVTRLDCPSEFWGLTGTVFHLNKANDAPAIITMDHNKALYAVPKESLMLLASKNRVRPPEDDVKQAEERIALAMRDDHEMQRIILKAALYSELDAFANLVFAATAEES